MRTSVDLWFDLDAIGRISYMLDQVGTLEGRPSSAEQRRWDTLYHDLREAREAYHSAVYAAQKRFQGYDEDCGAATCRRCQ